MKLKELLEILATPDHVDHKKALEMPVTFEIRFRRYGMNLTDVHVGNGRVHIEIK